MRPITAPPSAWVPGSASAGRVARKLAELTAQVAAQWQLGPVPQKHDIIAVDGALQLPDLIAVHQGGTIDARKPRGPKPDLEGGQRLPHHQTARRKMQHDIIVGRLG